MEISIYNACNFATPVPVITRKNAKKQIRLAAQYPPRFETDNKFIVFYKIIWRFESECLRGH